MRVLTAPTASAETAPGFPRLTLSLAASPEEVREVQRLRYKIFIDAMGLSSLVNSDGLDRDEFDAYCDHLIVRDSKTLRIVGTYRLLSAGAARRIGRFYSETEFDLGRLAHLRPRMVEAGRACIHPDYRSGGVLMMLWAGLAAYMRRERCDYLIGCASISLADGGCNAAAVYHSLSPSDLAPPEYRVMPHLPFPVGESDPADKGCAPPLLKGYLRSGAWVCGEPAWDADFHCADLFLMLPLQKLDDRYARHYLKETRPI